MAKKGRGSKTLRGPALCALGGLLTTAAFGLTISVSIGVVTSGFIFWYWLLILALAFGGFFFGALGLIYALRAGQSSS